MRYDTWVSARIFVDNRGDGDVSASPDHDPQGSSRSSTVPTGFRSDDLGAGHRFATHPAVVRSWDRRLRCDPAARADAVESSCPVADPRSGACVKSFCGAKSTAEHPLDGKLRRTGRSPAAGGPWSAWKMTIRHSLTPLNSSWTMGSVRRRDDNSRGKVQNVRRDSSG